MLINRVRKLAGGVANNLITCPLCRGFSYMEKHLGSIYCPLYGVARCSLWSGSKMYGSLWRNNRDPKVCPFNISQVSAVEECPLSGVPMYNDDDDNNYILLH